MKTISQIVAGVMSATEEKYLTSDEVEVLLRAAIIAARRDMFPVSRELQERFCRAAGELVESNDGLNEGLPGCEDAVETAREQYEHVVELVIEGMEL